jgi:hypothetical protein
MRRGLIAVPNRMGIVEWGASAFAVEFQRVPWPIPCWVQIGLEEPHLRPSQLGGLAQSLEKAPVSYGRALKV